MAEIIFVVLPPNCEIEFRENYKKSLNRENKSCANFFQWKLLPLWYSFDLPCYFRWTENKKVALQLIEAWDAIKQLYKFWDSLPKSKRPKCKSYFTLGNALKDNLIVAKLQFFVFCCQSSWTLSYKVSNRKTYGTFLFFFNLQFFFLFIMMNLKIQILLSYINKYYIINTTISLV